MMEIIRLDTTGPTPTELYKGICKLVEEMGEVNQVIGKLMAFPSGNHPDGKGDLRTRLALELADLKAAIEYFEQVNTYVPCLSYHTAEKVKRFLAWSLTGLKV